MKCAVCGKPEEKVPLFDGIYDGKLTKVCYFCSNVENITLIKKPTQSQLEEAERRHSVRELMEKISSPQGRLVAKENIMAHKTLAKLKFPEAKQEHGDLIQNYDWVLKQARRHSKLSISQVSEKTNVDKVQIESLESGKLFPGFEKVVFSLENFFDIKILSRRLESVAQLKNREKIEKTEKEILEEVRNKMGKHNFLVRNKPLEDIEKETETSYGTIDLDQIRHNKQSEQIESDKRVQKLTEEIESGKFDFSKKENLDKIRIQDLARLKKIKEEKEKITILKK